MAITVLVVAALYLLFIGLKMDVNNMTSFMVFKFPPVLLGIFVLLIAVAQWQHWPIAGIG